MPLKKNPAMKTGKARVEPMLGHGVDERPQAHGLVALVVLEGVARFVGGDAQGGDGGAVVDPFGQPQDLLPRVVVVGQLSRRLFDDDVSRSGRLEELVRGLGPRDAGRGEDLAVFAVRALDLGLGVKSQDQGRDDQ